MPRIETTLRTMAGTAIGIIVGTIATMGFIDSRAAEKAEERVKPVEVRVAGVEDDIRQANEKLDLLIEDCYRRGGCQKR